MRRRIYIVREAISLIRDPSLSETEHRLLHRVLERYVLEGVSLRSQRQDIDRIGGGPAAGRAAVARARIELARRL